MVSFRANLAERLIMQQHPLMVAFVLVWLIDGSAVAREADALSSWLSAQTNVLTWSADLVETRTFKSLASPLTARGHVQFAAPNRFRWELGQPPRTIAVRATNELLVIYPALHRVERFSLSSAKGGSWQEALGLLEVGFPRSRSDLEARYNILTQVVTNQTCQLVLEPKSLQARKMIPRLKVEFDTQDASLRATELQFADGSILRNDFTNSRLNPDLSPALFSPSLPADYRVVEPLTKSP